MNWLEQLKHNRLLREIRARTSRTSPPNPDRPISLETAATVAICFAADDIGERKYVLKLAERLKKRGGRVDLLAYLEVPIDANDGQLSCPTFSRKEKNWFGWPKSGRVDDFRERPVDLLLCLTPQPSLLFDAIAATKPAAIKVGWYSDRPGLVTPYHLNIDLPQPAKFAALVEQAEYILNKTTEPEPAMA
ncbi:MAG: hypothetical protein WBA17_17300 [Saprospiraceae bacterium]